MTGTSKEMPDLTAHQVCCGMHTALGDFFSSHFVVCKQLKVITDQIK